MSAAAQFLELVGIRLPIIQAPMAGVSTPAMAAAASNAGALGSMGVGAVDAAGARRMIEEALRLTDGSLNINVFSHRPATADAAKESAWIERLRALFAAFNAEPPKALLEIYKSFVVDDDMLELFLELKPRVVSLHFGVPDKQRIKALKDAGIVVVASATSLLEARVIVDAGIDAVVAQGYQAGGHRGMFDPDAADDRLDTLTLTRLLVEKLPIPVIAAGGIMDGAGIAAALAAGACAAQLGTAFIGCPESSADKGYRTALFSDAAEHTVMTRVISGRPARCLKNRFTEFGQGIDDASVPDYPVAYHAGKALHAAAKALGEFGFGAQWSGQGAPFARALPTADLVRTLAEELASSR